ncbi:hypothetical protein C0J52_24618 [Blattella germanica]|nr:hypothetical protein C0J52_24618 [Blattella germanica]
MTQEMHKTKHSLFWGVVNGFLMALLLYDVSKVKNGRGLLDLLLYPDISVPVAEVIFSAGGDMSGYASRFNIPWFSSL